MAGTPRRASTPARKKGESASPMRKGHGKGASPAEKKAAAPAAAAKAVVVKAVVPFDEVENFAPEVKAGTPGSGGRDYGKLVAIIALQAIAIVWATWAMDVAKAVL
jgi:hypothetical protein